MIEKQLELEDTFDSIWETFDRFNGQTEDILDEETIDSAEILHLKDSLAQTRKEILINTLTYLSFVEVYLYIY